MVKQTEYLKCVLSEDELRDQAQALARETQNIERLEDTKKQVTSDLKAKIDAANAKCRMTSQLITNGYEYRNVECEVYLNDPEPGQKTLYRTDTGEAVRTEKMTDAEKQQALPFEEVVQ